MNRVTTAALTHDEVERASRLIDGFRTITGRPRIVSYARQGG